MLLNTKLFSTTSQKKLAFGEWNVLKSLKSNYRITRVLMSDLEGADTQSVGSQELSLWYNRRKKL